ncbi:MAG: hypothetical protein K6A65_03610 [Succinivibrionaceae bacterium]|nr:hypothetical protein [Succinivibrionaceae bacterium]
MTDSIGGNSSLHSGVIKTLDNIKNFAQEIRQDMSQLSKASAQDQQQKLLEMQMKVGQYNAMWSMTANIATTINETMKNIANKV